MNTKETVFRIETESGAGPFVEGLVTRYTSDSMPAPHRDGIDEDIYGMLFGFHNLDDMFKYFRREDILQMLEWAKPNEWSVRPRKLVLSIYEVDRIIKGYTQCCFKGRRIDYIPLSEIVDWFPCSNEMEDMISKLKSWGN